METNSRNAADRPRTKVGELELTMFSDGTYLLDGGAMFGVVPKTLWSKRITPDERNLVAAGTNCVVVRGNGKMVLIETGIGNKLPQKLKSIYNSQERLLANLRAGGVEPEQIDVVINSHLHFDHCGWNTVLRDGKPLATFPNATYYAPRGEWEHGSKQLERDRISYISDNYDPLISSGQMELLARDGEIVPGIRVETFPGHTRHMWAVIIESSGETACYISDLIPTSRHLDITWCMAYDLFPLETIENRKRYYSRAIPEHWLTIFTHDHETPWAYLESPQPGKIVVSGSPEEI
jgi:glyoxylase-like metal-dependent hydrolase (beta-lactamase superfamily II)